MIAPILDDRPRVVVENRNIANGALSCVKFMETMQVNPRMRAMPKL